MNKTPATATGPATSRVGLPVPVAATPLDVGRCAYAHAARWLPYADHDVVAAATRTAWWPRWLTIATADPATLATPGDSAAGTLRVGTRPIQVRWTVTRRLRDIVTLEATHDRDVIAALTISLSNWHDGCVAELHLTCAAGSPHRLRRALRRSLDAVGATVDPVGTAILCGAWDPHSGPPLGQAGR